ncbi:hypothetical protein [Nonomuraea dietziae]
MERADAWDSFKQNLDQFSRSGEKKGVYRDSLGDARRPTQGGWSKRPTSP